MHNRITYTDEMDFKMNLCGDNLYKMVIYGTSV